MTDQEFYRYLYDQEITKKKDIDQATLAMSSLIVLVFGASWYQLTDGYAPAGTHIVVAVVSIACFLSLIASVVFLCLSFSGYRFRYIQNAKIIRSYQEDVRKSENANLPSGVAQGEFDAYLTDEIISSAAENAENNDNKMRHQLSAKRWIFVALSAFGCQSIVYFLGTVLLKVAHG